MTSGFILPVAQRCSVNSLAGAVWQMGPAIPASLVTHEIRKRRVLAHGSGVSVDWLPFAPERDGPDGALDRVVVEFDTAVIEEAREGWPARERVADGLGEGTGRWKAAAKLPLEPRLHHFDERPGAGVAGIPTCVCGAALDRSFDRIELGDPTQGLPARSSQT